MKSEERWRFIPGFGGRYDVSDQGRVRDMATGRMLTQTPSGANKPHQFHMTVSLVCQDRRRRNLYVHHLVARTFIGPRPDNAWVCHRDDNAANNALSNLYYGTARDNALDMARNGGRDPRRAPALIKRRLATLAAVRAAAPA